MKLPVHKLIAILRCQYSIMLVVSGKNILQKREMILPRVEKYLTRSLRSLMKCFSTLKEKFCISKRPCNILFTIINTNEMKHERHQKVRFLNVTIATVIISRVKIKSFCVKAHLVVHWCLYNKTYSCIGRQCKETEPGVSLEAGNWGYTAICLSEICLSPLATLP